MTDTEIGVAKSPDRLARGIEVLYDVAYAQGLLPQPELVGPVLPRQNDLRRRRAEHAARSPDAVAPNLRFDVLIVGSGYGGAVMAARLASTGKRVAVLERGREYLPGDFPDDLSQLPRHVRIDREHADAIIGSAEALFDVRSGENMSVVVGNALGGTSQINASVAIEPKPEAFSLRKDRQDPQSPLLWPSQIRAAAAAAANPNAPDVVASLPDAYARARNMLAAGPHPSAKRFDKYKSLESLTAALVATRRGGDSDPACRPLDLAIDFRPGDNPNRQGVLQSNCTDCGNCVSGCNYWAKSTLTMNYLPLARRFGAELYTGARVVAIEPSVRRTGSSLCENNWLGINAAARWIVHVERTADEGYAETAPQLELYADVVILAAGTLGSTEILLRSRNRGYLRCSAMLGKRFSGNGDMIAMGYRQSARATGVGRSFKSMGEPKTLRPGPTAVGVIDLRDGDNERFIVEDGTIPYPLEWLFREISATSGLIAQLTRSSLRTAGCAPDTDPLAADRESAEHTMTYLLMGLEDGCGSLQLGEERDAKSIIKRVEPDLQQNDLRSPTRLAVRWPLVSHEPVFTRQRLRLERAFERDARLGVFLPSPAWKPVPESVQELLNGEAPPGPVTTVHPLGGCPMGESREFGVVDHAGQVFDGDAATDDAVIAGLYVSDGSIVPGSLGANPLLTITALAERAAQLVAARENFGAVRLQPPDNAHSLPAPYVNAQDRPRLLPQSDETTQIVLKEVLSEPWGGPLARALIERYQVPLEGKQPAHLRLTLDIELRDPKRRQREFIDWLAQLGRKADITGTARIEHALHDADEPDVVGDEFSVSGSFDFLNDHLGRPAVAGRWRGTHATRAKWFVRSVRYLGAFYALLRARLGRELTQELYAWLKRWLGCSGTSLPRTPGSASRTWARVKALARYLTHMSAPRYMRYELDLTPAHGGAVTHLSGEKILTFRQWRSEDDEPNKLPGSPWLQIAEVPLALAAAPGASPVLGRLCIDIERLGKYRLPQIEQAPSALDGFQALASFALLFFRAVLERHVMSFKAPTYPSQNRKRPRGTGRLAGLTDPEHHWIKVTVEPREFGGEATPPLTRTKISSGDVPEQRSARILLTRYRAPREDEDDKSKLLKPREPLLFIHGFLHSGLIFAGNLKPGKNAVQYFCEKGFDVWVLELRTSTLLDTAAIQWTYDDVALGDIPRAIDYVLGNTGWEKLSVIAHCMGAAAFSMAALDGRLERTFRATGAEGSPGSKVRCAVLSQVGPLIEPTPANAVRAKAAAFIRDWLQVGSIDSAPDDSVTWKETLADRLAYSFPVPESKRRCHRDGWLTPRIDIAVCNRLTMMIGRNWEHDKLHSDTHRRMYDVLGAGNLTCFLQMAKFMARGLVTDQLGQNWYCIDALAQRHLDFPMLLFSGEHNDLFDPETTRLSCEWLRRVNPNTYYERQVIEGYCHLDNWLGKHADREVWGKVATFLAEGGSKNPVPPSAPRVAPPKPEVAILGWTRYENDKLIARVFAQVPEFETTSAYAGLTSVGGSVRAHFAREGILAPSFVTDVEVCRRGEPVPGPLMIGTWHPPRTALRLGVRGVARRLPMRRARNRLPVNRTWELRRGAEPENGVAVRVSQSLAEALARTDQISFFVGSCRWPGSLFETEASDSIFAAITQELDRAEQGARSTYPSFTLLVGDQVYMDASAELLDTGNVRERFRDYYERAFGDRLSPQFAALARRLPMYMAMDDHEIANDWSRSRLTNRHERFRWRIAKLGFRQYQWSHSPGPKLGALLPPPKPVPAELPLPGLARKFTARSAGEFPLWYDFESSGFCVFVMDTRSERDARHDKPPNGQAAWMISERQLTAFEGWLKNMSTRKLAGRPLFVVSACVLFPMTREAVRDPANACREDGWHGYPETRNRILRVILGHGLHNVVFISGDVHCAMSARVRICDGEKSVDAYCITASPLYAPMPFANAKPEDFALRGRVSLGRGCWADYEAVPSENCIVTGRSFTQVIVTADGNDWRIEAQVFDSDGKRVNRTVLRP